MLKVKKSIVFFCLCFGRLVTTKGRESCFVHLLHMGKLGWIIPTALL